MSEVAAPGDGHRGPDDGRRRRRRMHVIVFCLALVVRLLYQVVVVGMETAPVDDAAQYDHIAASVSHGGPYDDGNGFRSRRAPGFTLLLAGLYALTGPSWIAARILQAVLGALTCNCLLAVGRWSLGERTGLAAALACAVFPYTVFWSGFLLSEALCMLFVTAATWALLRTGTSARSAIPWAVLCGLGALTRPNVGLLFVLGLPWVLGRSRRPLISAAAAVAAFGLTLLPWTVRNYEVHGRFIPVTTMGGFVLYEGNNPIVASTPALRGRSLPGNLGRDEPEFNLPEVEQDRALGEKAVRFMRENPGEMPGLVAIKFVRLWNPFPQLDSIWQRWLAFLTLVPVTALFCIGLLIAVVRRERIVWPLVLPILAVTITGLVYWADARIRSPADPMVLLLAAHGLIAGVGRRT